MLFGGNLKLAFDSITHAKFRSFLTMLGIIIGIASVVTTVSLGEGVKKQISDQINHLGTDLITIRPGNIVRRDDSGKIISYNFSTGFGIGSLTEDDFRDIQKIKHVANAVPLNIVTGVAEAQGKQYPSGFVIATTEDAPHILNRRVEHGNFFEAEDANRYVAIIGKRVAEQLFEENAPIAKTIRIRNYDFIVKGVFEEIDDNSVVTGGDYNNAVFIPFNIGKQISDGQTQIAQVMVRPDSPANVETIIDDIEAELAGNHAGQKDFTILRPGETLSAVSYLIDIVTSFIAGIAAISLLVGGIGIMNIMLFTISERTWEIGIRKSIGATNRQIRSQFMTEAILISVVGGIIGIAISIGINATLRITTEFEPVVTLPVIGIATGVSLAVGILFGTFPAVRAARLDPIEALRRG